MSKDVVKKYSNKDLTIVWKPNLCIHSENCFHGLPKVFNPDNRPWINALGASSDDIKTQVGKCPSGALSIDSGEEVDGQGEHGTITIEVSENGPLLIKGPGQLKNKGKVEQLERSTTALCRCGGSSNKPFCDGTHKKINFQG